MVQNLLWVVIGVVVVKEHTVTHILKGFYVTFDDAVLPVGLSSARLDVDGVFGTPLFEAFAAEYALVVAVNDLRCRKVARPFAKFIDELLSGTIAKFGECLNLAGVDHGSDMELR